MDPLARNFMHYMKLYRQIGILARTCFYKTWTYGYYFDELKEIETMEMATPGRKNKP